MTRYSSIIYYSPVATKVSRYAERLHTQVFPSAESSPVRNDKKVFNANVTIEYQLELSRVRFNWDIVKPPTVLGNKEYSTVLFNKNFQTELSIDKNHPLSI